MHLSSCRALKQEILSKAYNLATKADISRSYSIRRAARARAREVHTQEAVPVAAIGVAPSKGKDYKLAVRIFKGQEARKDLLMKGLGRYRGEIDLVTGVRYVPRITVRPGVSCGHYRITAGTLGGFVEDNDNYYIISNNHVLANSNQCFGGDRILQPGPDDINGSFNVIGHLHRWYPLSKEGTNSIDAAIATFSDEVDFFEPWDYAGIGRIKKTPVTDRFGVTRVIKRGRTTGVTRGRVSAFELDGVTINYGSRRNPAVVTYDDQIEVVGDPPATPFSDGGDSGSFIIDRDTMKPYALLYGGGPDDQGIDRTLAHFMPTVLKAMKVKLVQ